MIKFMNLSEERPYKEFKESLAWYFQMSSTGYIDPSTYTGSQIQSFVDLGLFSDGQPNQNWDLISTSRDGPWVSLKDIFDLEAVWRAE